MCIFVSGGATVCDGIQGCMGPHTLSLLSSQIITAEVCLLDSSGLSGVFVSPGISNCDWKHLYLLQLSFGAVTGIWEWKPGTLLNNLHTPEDNLPQQTSCPAPYVNSAKVEKPVTVGAELN